MKRCNKLIKTIQRRIYDFLLTRYGLTLFCFGFILVIICLLQLSDTILEYRLTEFKQIANLVKLKSDVNHRNLTNFITDRQQKIDENDESSYFYPDEANQNGYFNLKATNIDVVYTWVNGSDPQHLEQLKKYKLDTIKSFQSNSSDSKPFLKVEFYEFYYKIISSTKKSNQTTAPSYTQTRQDEIEEDLAKWPCFHKLCMQTNNLIVIQPQLKPSDKQAFLQAAKITFTPALFSNISIDAIKSIYHEKSLLEHATSDLIYNSSLSILFINNFDFKSNQTVLEQMQGLFRAELMSKSYKLYMGYYTIDCSLAVNCVKDLNRTFIAKRVKDGQVHVIAPKFDRFGYLNNIGKFENNRSNIESITLKI